MGDNAINFEVGQVSHAKARENRSGIGPMTDSGVSRADLAVQGADIGVRGADCGVSGADIGVSCADSTGSSADSWEM